PVGFGTDQNKALGIPGPGGVTTANGISLIGGGDGTYIEYLGDFGQYVIKQKALQLSDSVTWLRGNHSFKFGGNMLRRELDEDRTRFGKGFYFFRDSFGQAPGYTGYEVSDMLLAATNFTATGIPGFVPRETISWENAVFAQDEWRINPNLTVNLGLRWDLLTPYYEKDNKLANYDPTTGKLVLAGQNGASRSTLKTNKNNFGPRLGFDYLFDQRTALRGAYGAFYSLDRGGIDNPLTDNLATVVTSAGFGGAVADRLTTIMYIGDSKYDALQASMRRRESNGLSYLASYTFGHATNEGPGFFPGNPSRGGSFTDPSCV